MKADFSALWAEAPSTLRREPTNAELAGGFPCGPLDLPLFNELIFRLSEAQREIVYAIVQSGQTPNANNTTQLWQAMRSLAPESGIIHYGTATGPANAYTVASFVPVINELPTGTILEVFIPAANTGPSTLTLSQYDPDSVRPIVRSDGSALKQNDLVVGPVALSKRQDGSLSILNYNPVNAPARNNITYRNNGTFTVPDGCYFIYAQVWGGGGGGGGGTYDNGGTTGGAGGGGAGGGYDDGFFFVMPGQNFAVTVGAGGAGGPGSNNGGTGGTTSVGALISATGGPGGLGAANLLQGTGGGDGGVGFGGNINGRGAPGGTAFSVTPGSSAGACGGIGGQGSFGGGSPSLNVGGAGSSGNFPAGGGNGSANNGAAGAGAPGLVRISF